jgi:hypothetical protein
MFRFHGSAGVGYWYHLSSAFVLLMNILIEILLEQYLRMHYLQRPGAWPGAQRGRRPGAGPITRMRFEKLIPQNHGAFLLL